MTTTTNNVRALTFFKRLLRRPKLIVALALALFLGTAAWLPTITKDTRGDAFLSPDNPALLYRDKVKQQFGLNDPIVVAVVSETKQGIYTPQILAFLARMTSAIMQMDNVDRERVISLWTESNIIGTEEGMEVDDFYQVPLAESVDVARIRESVENFPLYHGSIVSKDAQVALIVVELLNQDISSQTYQAILATVERQRDEFNRDAVSPVAVHVAGEAAIAGYLGDYIDRDMQVLNPLAGLLIFTIIVIGFSRLVTGLFTLILIATTVLGTLGIMAAFQVPFYVITNALPVILIGIAVADSIHILSQYFELQAKEPETPVFDLVVRSMAEMWWPVTLTSLTTMAGFLGLYLAAYMPPFKFFGLFAALGVGLAWIFSMTLLPALICIIKPTVSRSFKANYASTQLRKYDLFTASVTYLGQIAVRHAPVTVGIGAAIIACGLYASSRLIVDEDRIETFNHQEAIYQADRLINRHTNGTNNLDIIVETENREDLFEPDVLAKIEALQNFALQYPQVRGATSIVDYLKQMNRSLHGGRANEYRLPADKELVAQYFLLYSASGDPTDFEEEVDYDYRVANVRLTLNTGSYRDNRALVRELQNYVDTTFNGPGLKATLTGRVTVDYFWIHDLKRSHLVSLAIALVLVWAVSTLLFRSISAGLYTVFPVCVSLLLVYSAMVIQGIPLGIGTSMFASVAIGLGIDFAIHTLDRLRAILARDNFLQVATATGLRDQGFEKALLKVYPGTGRALLLNFAVVAGGFAVLMVSKVVPLNDFGGIVVIAVTSSFLASMCLLPAVLKLLQPSFLFKPGTAVGRPAWVRSILGVAVVGIALGLTLYLGQARAGGKTLPDASWVVTQINAVDEGEQVTRNLQMVLMDRHGKTRERETAMFQRYYDEEKRTLIVYKAPSNVKGIAFLTYDYPDAATDDDQWLYLPAMRKSRRISSSNRGDYFLGTDFTYEDIKKEGKLELSDYRFETLDESVLNGTQVIHMAAVPKTPAIEQELGYSRTELWVDKSNWIILKTVYWDVNGNLLKTLNIDNVRKVDGIWSRHTLMIENHKTGHHTKFHFSDIDYKTPIDDNVFSKRALARQ